VLAQIDINSYHLLEGDSGVGCMNLRFIIMKYFGWCPGYDSASKFKSSMLANVKRVLKTSDFRMAVTAVTTILFLGTLLVPQSLPGLILVSPPAPSEEGIIGNVLVTRYERYWQDNIAWVSNRDHFRASYRLIYEIFFYNETDRFVLIDQISEGLNYNSVGGPGDHENIEASYNSTDGRIMIEISETNPHPEPFQKYVLWLWFDSPPINKFNVEPPETLCDPPALSRGLETDLEISISPFRIADLDELQTVQITAFFTVNLEDSSHLSSTPDTWCDPSQYGAMWYYDGTKASFERHSTTYHVLIKPDAMGVIFRTCVSLRYGKPIHVTGEPAFAGSIVEFIDQGTYFDYQNEHGIAPSKRW